MTTSDSVTTGLDSVPQACTLPATERPSRLAEFDDLFANAVERGERLSPHHLRLTLTGPTDLNEQVRDLAARESECCSFFAFTISSRESGHVLLDVEVPAAHVDILDALAQRAIRIGSSR